MTAVLKTTSSAATFRSLFAYYSIKRVRKMVSYSNYSSNTIILFRFRIFYISTYLTDYCECGVILCVYICITRNTYFVLVHWCLCVNNKPNDHFSSVYICTCTHIKFFTCLLVIIIINLVWLTIWTRSRFKNLLENT